jgi:hypothetical protein
VVDQTHQDYKLVVVDESTIFDIHQVIGEFKFQDVSVVRLQPTEEQRRLRNPVGENMNLAMPLAKEGLVCFLCDDDYYYPDWFSSASRYFDEHPEHQAGFGILNYSKDPAMVLAPKTLWGSRFFNHPITDPYCLLDHTQIVHRIFTPPYRWPEDFEKIKETDGYYFREIAKLHPFHPIPSLAVVKREHPKAIRWNVEALKGGTLEASRE